MSNDFIEKFCALAHLLEQLPFEESLVCNSVVNDFVDIILVLDKQIDVEITQRKDVSEVAFTISHVDVPIFRALAEGSTLVDKMLAVLNET